MSDGPMSGRSQRKPTPGVSARPPASVMSRWRWFIYAVAGAGVFVVIFLKVAAAPGVGYASRGAWLQAGAWGDMCVSGVFTGLIMALLKLFLDPVFLGIAQRRSKLLLAEELAIRVVQTAAGVATEGVLGAVAGSAGGSESDGLAGGAGSFSGGGASGKY